MIRDSERLKRDSKRLVDLAKQEGVFSEHIILEDSHHVSRLEKTQKYQLLPLLVNLLKEHQSYDPRVYGFIVSSLGIKKLPKKYGYVVDALLDIFENYRVPIFTDSNGVSMWDKVVNLAGMRWDIASAIESIRNYTPSQEAIILDLVSCEKYEGNRQMLVLALKYCPTLDPVKVNNILTRLLNNENLIGHAAIALAKVGVADSLPKLKSARNTDDRKWVTKEIDNALKKIKDRNP